MRRIIVVSFTAAAFAAAGHLSGNPEAAGSGVLRSPVKAVTWTGHVTAGQQTAGPIECATGCDHFQLEVALPPMVWAHRSGGVQVAIRWTSTLGDNLRLYVYRDGTQLAKSDGIIAIAQGVLIPAAADGVYDVYVAHDPDSPTQSIAYEGLAEVEYDPRPAPLRALMPDLEARPQQNLGFDPGGIFFDEISALYPSCYRTEVEEEGATLCLRFDQIFANVGDGNMELRFSVPTAAPDGNHPVFQRIYWSDGTHEDRLTGEVEFHPEHAHYHFASFGLSRLWSVDESGRRAGHAPIRQKRWRKSLETTLVRSGRKVSFCLADTNIDFWGRKGDGPRRYIAPDCLFPFESDGTTDHYVQGITRGWADIYDWYLPDQYIDVAGIPDGDYVLETIADPDGLLREADESNNCDSILIRIAGTSTSAPSAVILGPGPRCTALGQ
jgi:hypothetical protein